MIDEKKIEEAVVKASITYSDGRYEDLGFQDGFLAGINWFLDNLWHNASEEPKIGKRVIVELKDREGQERFYISDRDPRFSWKAEVKVCGFIRWFYVEDLLKGGK